MSFEQDQEIERLNREIAKAQSKLRVANGTPENLDEWFRMMWRRTFVHWYYLLRFRTFVGDILRWIERRGGPRMCWRRPCGHRAVLFGQCDYHLAEFQEMSRDVNGRNLDPSESRYDDRAKVPKS
jgi:hypothetical protein